MAVRTNDIALGHFSELWLPLGAGDVVALLFDRTARVSLRDVFVPFETSYGALAIGLGTVSLDILLVVTLTSWLRRTMHQTLWRWIHRSSYLAFGAPSFHSLLSGTDFGTPLVSAIA